MFCEVLLQLRFYSDKISLLFILPLFSVNQLPAGVEKTF